MKVYIITIFLLVFATAYSFELQDSTKNKNQEQVKEKNKEQDRLQVQEQVQEKVKEQSRHKEGTGVKQKDGKKRMKDVFIDKDGDGIADTRQGGMSLNKLRKRARTGGHGSGGGNSPGYGGR